jgi:hypothetical protein
MHQTTIQLDKDTRRHMAAIAARHGWPETRHATDVICRAVFQMDMLETAQAVLTPTDFAGFVTALYRPVADWANADDAQIEAWEAERDTRAGRILRQIKPLSERAAQLDEQTYPLRQAEYTDEIERQLMPLEQEYNALMERVSDLLAIMDTEVYGRPLMIHHRDENLP